MARTLRTTLGVLPLLAALLAIAVPGRAYGQEREITGVVTGTEGSRIPLAIAPPLSGGNLSSSVEMLATLRADLEFTGYFNVLDEERSRLVSPATDESKIPLQEWLSVGADFVLVTRVSEEPGRIDLEARLLDAHSGEMVLGRRYGGTSDLTRRVAHRVADDIVKQLTGQNGIAQTRIAYVARTAPGVKEIYLMDYDGARPRRLTRTGTLCLSPTWSPDAERLSYISFRGQRPGIDIVDREGAISRLPTAAGDLNSAPDWSPDGKRMAYSSTRDGNSELYLMDMASGAERRLTNNPGIDSAPSWSPTGREIAFTSSRAGSPQIYLMDDEGLNIRRLTFEGTYNESAAWSPRGDRIAYVSRIQGQFQILVHDLATGLATQITQGPGNNENPRWSPDGRHLVFASDRMGSYAIYTMGADGSSPRVLTSGDPAYTPDWSH